jgi:hypothetical protein
VDEETLSHQKQAVTLKRTVSQGCWAILEFVERSEEHWG